MNKKPKKPIAADKNANDSANNAREPQTNFDLGDFERWLDAQLAVLEASYESFATTNSQRAFFNRESR